MLKKLGKGELIVSNYYLMDKPKIINAFFYPRDDLSICPENAFDVFIPVDKNVSINCRCYTSDKNAPSILYFHGNGEVVGDYDDIAFMYNEKGLNLVVADYRGYGASEGMPSFANMVTDSHFIFKAIREELARRDFKQDLLVMGRSLGSVSALELAVSYQDEIKGLIIESGFISAVRLVKHAKSLRDVNIELLEQECLDNTRNILIPSLVIHGQYDNLVPTQEGRDLFQNLGAGHKRLVVIPYAGHNDIMFIDSAMYFDAIEKFVNDFCIDR